MSSVVTKKVRLSSAEARHLASLARDLDLTESEVLRQGMSMMDVVRDRRRNIGLLIAMSAGEKEPPKIRFQLR